MIQDDVAALLRIKRVRERRAATALGKARLAEAQAAATRAEAEASLSSHAIRQRALEAATYEALLAAPSSGRKVQDAASRLAQGAARGGILRQHLNAANAELSSRTEDVRRAQAAKQQAVRAVETADGLLAQLLEREQVREMWQQESALEEVAGQLPSGRRLGP